MSKVRGGENYYRVDIKYTCLNKGGEGKGGLLARLYLHMMSQVDTEEQCRLDLQAQVIRVDLSLMPYSTHVAPRSVNPIFFPFQ